MITLTPAELDEIKKALEANGVFHTPLTRLQLSDKWNDFHTDAAERTRTALGIIEGKENGKA